MGKLALNLARKNIRSLLKKNSTKCLINEDDGYVFLDEDFYHDKGVKKAYGLDSSLAEYTGINVIKAFFYSNLSLNDIVEINEKKYGVLEIIDKISTYLRVILYEDDFTLDFTFVEIITKDTRFIATTNGRTITTKGRLKSLSGDIVSWEVSNKPKLPETKGKATHRMTIKYSEECKIINDTWVLNFNGERYRILSVENHNGNNKFLVFNCVK